MGGLIALKRVSDVGEDVRLFGFLPFLLIQRVYLFTKTQQIKMSTQLNTVVLLSLDLPTATAPSVGHKDPLLKKASGVSFLLGDKFLIVRPCADTNKTDIEQWLHAIRVKIASNVT